MALCKGNGGACNKEAFYSSGLCKDHDHQKPEDYPNGVKWRCEHIDAELGQSHFSIKDADIPVFVQRDFERGILFTICDECEEALSPAARAKYLKVRF